MPRKATKRYWECTGWKTKTIWCYDFERIDYKLNLPKLTVRFTGYEKGKAYYWDESIMNFSPTTLPGPSAAGTTLKLTDDQKNTILTNAQKSLPKASKGITTKCFPDKLPEKESIVV
ncbi:MAG: hypothetical protein GPJ52_02580 [Candidatus Heimdallarchaeota archaeon]|nr:hypothetical protein [Candidatus Heimdallarchaeota archaeon]